MLYSSDEKKLIDLFEKNDLNNLKKFLLNAQREDGTYRELTPDPRQTAYALGILKELSFEFKEPETKKWVLSLQTGKRGFGETTGQNSWDYTTFWGSLMHSYLSIKPKYGEHFIKFINYHQTQTGGFSGFVGGAQNLMSTLDWISSLQILGYNIKNKKIIIKYLNEILNKNLNNLHVEQLNRIVWIIDKLGGTIQQKENIIFRLNKEENKVPKFLQSLENIYFQNKILGLLQAPFRISQDRIFHHFNADGGFSNFLGERSDLSSTFFAVKTLNLIKSDLPFREKIINFVLNNRTQKGGFYDSKEKSVYSCFCAVHSLDLLNMKPLDVESLSTWLKYSQNEDGGFGTAPNTESFEKGTYWVVSSLEKLNKLSIINLEGLRNYLIHNLQPNPFNLYYILGTSQIIGIYDFDIDYANGLERELLEYRNKDGGFSNEKKAESEMYEAFRAVSALNALQIFFQKNNCDKNILTQSLKKSIKNWISSCESKGGGFSWIPKERSYLQPTYHALDTLEILGLKIKNRDKHINWILKFQNIDGGFNGGDIGTPSDINSTFWALESLKVLSNEK